MRSPLQNFLRLQKLIPLFPGILFFRLHLTDLRLLFLIQVVSGRLGSQKAQVKLGTFFPPNLTLRKILLGNQQRRSLWNTLLHGNLRRKGPQVTRLHVRKPQRLVILSILLTLTVHIVMKIVLIKFH
ncbi:unnamed protein product [Protopolystoma xenopodis]|uniref:Uncharacterized protein n=1 Tax=Protopolystoma xenopodis TaxID=117903 RepID=A0A448X4N0_9PLAT|nr:unnamed protein product [Protopolystoma xenopodis]